MFGPRTDFESIFDNLFKTPSQPTNFNFETKTVTEIPSKGQTSYNVVLEERGTRATLVSPGISKDNITITVKNDTIIEVKGTVDDKYNEKKFPIPNVKNVNISFNVKHSFERNEIEVKHENGVLEIFIPSHDEPEENNEYTVDF